VLCGLAGAAKLNGLAAAVAGAGLVLVTALTEPGATPLRRRLTLAAGGAGVVLASAYATFVAVNPFLYHDTVERTIAMFDHRVEEMQKQYEDFPPSRIETLGDRLDIVSERVFDDDTSIHYPDLPRLPDAITVNLSLTILGLGYLVWLTWQWATRRRVTDAAAVILAFGLFSAGPALLTPLDWPRYYLFPVIFSTLCIAVAIGVAAQLALRFIHSWRQRIENRTPPV
jgi:hypothetical protein